MPRGFGSYAEPVRPLRVGIIGFDGLDALDLVGPAEAFATARAEEANRSSTNAYQVMVIGLSRAAFRG